MGVKKKKVEVASGVGKFLSLFHQVMGVKPDLYDQVDASGHRVSIPFSSGHGGKVLRIVVMVQL